jgi:hypothetical protein
MTSIQRVSLAALVILAVYAVGACGSGALTPEQENEERLHIAQTVDALPQSIKGPTQTAIMATILQGINQP